jgi:hypothetical protein
MAMHWTNIGQVKRQVRAYDGHRRRPGAAAALRAFAHRRHRRRMRRWLMEMLAA